MLPTIQQKITDFDTFTVISKPNGLFLKESSWPVHVQFAKEFFTNCDERFARFHVKPYLRIEIKLENASAIYSLSDDPFRKVKNPEIQDFYGVWDLIEGTLVEGKVLPSDD